MSTATLETEASVADLTLEAVASRDHGDGAKVDRPRLTAAVESFIAEFGPFLEASQKVAEQKRKLGDLLMQTRLSVILPNGQPDYWGAGKTYRAIMADWLIPTLAAKYSASNTEVTALLNTVRTNYVNREEMVKNAVVAQAIKTGDIPKEAAEKYQAAVAAHDGDPNKVPAKEIPADVKKVVRKTFKDASKNVPEQMGGAARGTGGNTPKSPEAITEAVNEAVEVLSTVQLDGQGGLSPAAAVEALHRYATRLSDALIGAPGTKGPEAVAGGKQAIGEALFAVSELLSTTAAVLSGVGGKEEVSGNRFTPAA